MKPPALFDAHPQKRNGIVQQTPYSKLAENIAVNE